MAEALLRDSKVASTTDDRYQVVVNVDSSVLAKEVFEKPDGSPDCYIEDQVALPVETARRLSCSCKIVTALTRDGEPLSIGRSTRAISLPIKRALKLRDVHCTFPGCDCHKNLQTHHIIHWANGGETSMENLTLVCSYHHTALHEGQYSVERLPNKQLIFRRPDGRVLHQHVQRPDVALEASSLPSTSLPSTGVEPWSWCGDSMDYSCALSALSGATREALRHGEWPLDAAQGDATQSDAAQSDTTQPDATQSDTAQSDASRYPHPQDQNFPGNMDGDSGMI